MTMIAYICTGQNYFHLIMKVLSKLNEFLNGELLDGDRFSTVLFVLALAGFCLRLPLILNIIIQLCFLACTLHVAYRYLKARRYVMALSKLALIFGVVLVDDIYIRMLISN